MALHTAKSTELCHTADISSREFVKVLDKLKKKGDVWWMQRVTPLHGDVLTPRRTLCGSITAENCTSLTISSDMFSWGPQETGYQTSLLHPWREGSSSFLLWSQWSTWRPASGQVPCLVVLLSDCQKVVTAPGAGPGPPYRPPKSPRCGLTSGSDCIVIPV